MRLKYCILLVFRRACCAEYKCTCWCSGIPLCVLGIHFAARFGREHMPVRVCGFLIWRVVDARQMRLLRDCMERFFLPLSTKISFDIYNGQALSEFKKLHCELVSRWNWHLLSISAWCAFVAWTLFCVVRLLNCRGCFCFYSIFSFPCCRVHSVCISKTMCLPPGVVCVENAMRYFLWFSNDVSNRSMRKILACVLLCMRSCVVQWYMRTIF